MKTDYMADVTATTACLDVIVSRLAADPSFPEAFFEVPRQALQNAGLELSEEELRRVESTNWVKARTTPKGFKDENVLRCSAGY